MNPPNRPQSSTQAFERLLANEGVLIVNPVLAQAIGLEASLLFRQLAYWLDQNEKKERQNLFQEARWWSFSSYGQWRDENFPFLSISSIRRHFAQLEALGLVISTQKYNPNPMLQSKWYSIDIPAYNAFMALWEALGKPSANESKAESKAAYSRFLQNWKGVRANLKSGETGLSTFSPNKTSFSQNAADGVQADTFAQDADNSGFIPPYWQDQGLAIPPRSEISDSHFARPLDVSEAFSLPQWAAAADATDASIPRQLDDSLSPIPRPSDTAEQESVSASASSNWSIPDEQGDIQAEQSICSERAAHLSKLNSPIKETIEEIKKENQKEIQEQELKTIASQSEAYVSARFVKDSQILEANTTNVSSEKSSDGAAQNSPAASSELEAAPVKNSTETLGAKILSHYSALEHEGRESGFARAARPKNKPVTKGSQSSNASPQTATHSPQLQSAVPTKAGNMAQKPAAKAKTAALTKAGNAAPKAATSPKADAQSEASARATAADSTQKPDPQGETATASSQTAAGDKTKNAQRAKSSAEAKRLRTPGLSSAAAETGSLYAEVVRRVFSSASELLKADSAFVGLWIGFFRGSLKETAMKSHKSHQLSKNPMDPACILAFSLWYRERYKQETLPRSPETLRVRCDEFRALPSMDAWLEKGQQQLNALKTALAAGTEPKLETQAKGFSYATAKPPLDESDMQAFDWNEFFKE